MAEQTGQYGYLFKFDKVNATARCMLLRLHLGMKRIRLTLFCSDHGKSGIFG